MTNLRRAAGFAAVATLSLGASVLGGRIAVAFGLVALAAFAVTDGPAFETFALPADRQAGRLYGLASFSLAATGLAVLTTAFGMPVAVFVATVLIVGYGNLARELLTDGSRFAFGPTVAFVLGGTVAALAGQVAVAWLQTGTATTVRPEMAFLAASAALLASLLYAVFVERDDPLVMLSVALLLWLFADLAVQPSWTQVAVAVVVPAGFGYVSWRLDTASIPGMLTGVFLGLLTVVLGGYGWFVSLIAFFGVGGLATKFRYEEKLARGVAEDQGGARGSGNVLGNAAPALLAVLLFAATPKLPVGGEVFRYAFAGSLATALGDTLSSEIGGLYDDPWLVTSFERVEPGTDGAVTWQGELAGLAGGALIAGLAFGLLDVPPLGAAVVVVAGFLGMTADSVLGATLEGGGLGNQAVNFLATLTGAVAGAALAVALGLAGL